MINKQSLWFLTLFSLILVLSVYYITMPNDLLVSKDNKEVVEKTSKEIDNNQAVIKENELLVTMRVNKEEEREEQIKNLRTKLTDEETSSDEKNSCFEQIKYITNLNTKEKALEEKIKKEFDLDSFVKIDNNNIKVVAVKSDHDINLANNIMKSIQQEFENKVTISIQFEK